MVPHLERAIFPWQNAWYPADRRQDDVTPWIEAFVNARKDALSLGICNGCQLMVELNLINPEHEHRTRMLHNNSHKFESTFLGLEIPQNNSVMFSSLSGDKLGIWEAHGEGKYSLPKTEYK